MFRVSLAALAVLIATPALAQTPVSEAVTTAPATVDANATAASSPAVATVATKTSGEPLSTAQQIDAYLRNSPPLDITDDTPTGTTGPAGDGKIHGVVEAGIGTGGYRSLYMQSDIPIGDKAMLSIAVSQGRGRGYWGGGGFGYDGFGYGGPAYSYGYGGPGAMGLGGWGPGRFGSSRSTSSSVGLGFSFNSESRDDDSRCQRQPVDAAGIEVLPSSIGHCRRDLRR